MQRNHLWALAFASAVVATSAFAQAPEVTLTRLACGDGTNDQRRFSDSFAYQNDKMPFTFSCYVIKHGSDAMVWDTGYAPGSVTAYTQTCPASAPDGGPFTAASYSALHTGTLSFGSSAPQTLTTRSKRLTKNLS